MAIYALFFQHIIHSLNETGKAAIVIPTGFITAQTGIDKKIREKIVESKMIRGVVSMPSNIFATTGTNVSIVFLDKTNKEDVVLIDASGLGEKVKDENGNQKTELTNEEVDRIVKTFNQKKGVDDFSVVVSYDEIAEKNYSLSAGQYFEIKLNHIDISSKEFNSFLNEKKNNIKNLFDDSSKLEKSILSSLENLSFEN